MNLDIGSAVTSWLLLLGLWFTPLLLFALVNKERGFARLNWALLLSVLTWPGYLIYLLQLALRKR